MRRSFEGPPGRKKAARALLARAQDLALQKEELVERIAELLRRREHAAYLHALHIVDYTETREKAIEQLREIVGQVDGSQTNSDPKDGGTER